MRGYKSVMKIKLILLPFKFKIFIIFFLTKICLHIIIKWMMSQVGGWCLRFNGYYCNKNLLNWKPKIIGFYRPIIARLIYVLN